MVQLAQDIEIEPARKHELHELPRIEREAGKLFSSEFFSLESGNGGLPLSFFEEASAAGRLWVARTARPCTVVGFAAVILVDGSAHLHEMDVLPEHSRRGIGRRLLSHVAEWARRSRYPSLTLLTFRNVPWNAPFYRSAGFTEIAAEDVGPELRLLIEEEVRKGLDRDERVSMVLDLTEIGG